MRAKSWLIVLPAISLLSIISCDDDPSGPGVETGPVTITVNLENEDPQTYFVVVHRSDGSVAEQLSLSKGAGASADIRDGDMVTLLRFNDEEWQMTTITGLQIGQNIQLGRTRPSGFPPTAHVITLDADFPPGVTSLEIGTMCTRGGGGFSFPRDFEIWDQCMTASGRLNFLLFAMAPTGGRSHFAYAADVPADPSGTTLIDLRGAWRTDWQDFLLTFENQEQITRGNMSVDPYRDGQGIGQLHWENFVSNGVSMDFPMQIPTGFPERLSARVQIDENSAVRHIRERFSVNENSTAHTVTGAPPKFTNLAVTGADTDRPTVGWDLSANTAGADAISAYIGWNTPDESMYWSWVIHVPADAGPVQFPALPDELAAARPPADGRFLDLSIEWIDDSTIDGFADYVQNNVERDGFEEDIGDAKLMTSEAWLEQPE